MNYLKWDIQAEGYLYSVNYLGRRRGGCLDRWSRFSSGGHWLQGLELITSFLWERGEFNCWQKQCVIWCETRDGMKCNMWIEVTVNSPSLALIFLLKKSLEKERRSWGWSRNTCQGKIRERISTAGYPSTAVFGTTKKSNKKQKNVPIKINKVFWSPISQNRTYRKVRFGHFFPKMILSMSQKDGVKEKFY